MKRRLATVREAAEYLGYRPRTLWNRLAPSSADPFPLKPIRMGRRLVFDWQDLEKFVEDLKTISSVNAGK